MCAHTVTLTHLISPHYSTYNYILNYIGQSPSIRVRILVRGFQPEESAFLLDGRRRRWGWCGGRRWERRKRLRLAFKRQRRAAGQLRLAFKRHRGATRQRRLACKRCWLACKRFGLACIRFRLGCKRLELGCKRLRLDPEGGGA